MAHNFHTKYHVPHDVGVVDGTLFPIEFKPERKDYPDFKGRKGEYTTMTCLIVNCKQPQASNQILSPWLAQKCSRQASVS